MPQSVLDFQDDSSHSVTYRSFEKDGAIQRLLAGASTDVYAMSPDSDDQHSQTESSQTPLVPPQHGTEPSRCRKAALMCACLYMQFLNSGAVIALGVVYVELIDDLGSLRSEAALVQSLYLGLSLGGTVLFARAIMRWDAGYILVISNITCCLAFGLCMTATNIWTVVALVGVVGGLAASVAIIAAAMVVNWTFTGSRKAALSALTMGAAAAQVVMPYVTDALINQFGWRGCLLIIGGLYLNTVVGGLLIHFSKTFFHRQNVISNKSGTSMLTSMLKDPAILLFLLIAFLFPCLGPLETWFVVDLAILKGYSREQGTEILSLNGVSAIVTRLLMTVYIQRNPSRRAEHILALGLLVWGLAHILIILTPYYWGMMLIMFVRGASNSMVIASLPAMQLALRGPNEFPVLASLTFFLNGIGEILGGYVGGLSFDVTGSYDLIFFIGAGTFVFQTICCEVIYIILRRRFKNETKMIYEKL